MQLVLANGLGAEMKHVTLGPNISFPVNDPQRLPAPALPIVVACEGMEETQDPNSPDY